MIRVDFDATLRVRGSVELNMTEEQFDSLSEASQNRVLENAIDWQSVLSDAETDEIDIEDVTEIK